MITVLTWLAVGLLAGISEAGNLSPGPNVLVYKAPQCNHMFLNQPCAIHYTIHNIGRKNISKFILADDGLITLSRLRTILVTGSPKIMGSLESGAHLFHSVVVEPTEMWEQTPNLISKPVNVTYKLSGDMTYTAHSNQLDARTIEQLGLLPESFYNYRTGSNHMIWLVFGMMVTAPTAMALILRRGIVLQCQYFEKKQ